MAIQKKQVWLIVGVLALFGAGAVALTTPRDTTHFVSVHAPSPGKSGRTTAAKPSAAVSATRLGAEADAPAPARAENGAIARAAASDRPQAARADRAGAVAAGRNLFRPLVAKTGSIGAGLAPAMLPPLPGFEGLMPLSEPSSPEEKRQRAYWSYVGTVELEGATYALIEERKSKAGVYMRQGDAFRGGQVVLVRPEYVVLSLAGKRYVLPKSTGLAETPVEVASQPAPGSVPPPTAPGQAVPSAGSPYGSSSSRAPYSGSAYPPGDERARWEEERRRADDERRRAEEERARYDRSRYSSDRFRRRY